MVVQEISDRFDYAANKAVGGLVLDEYNKSLYLTKAQHMVVRELIKMYEYTDEIRHIIPPLLVTVPILASDFTAVDDYYTTVVPVNIINTIAYEELNDKIPTIPLDLNDIHYTRKSPFRKPDKNIAYRSNFGDGEIRVWTDQVLSVYKYTYVKQPLPIVLEDITSTGLEVEGQTTPQTCALNDDVTIQIIDRAVVLAIEDIKRFAPPPTKEAN